MVNNKISLNNFKVEMISLSRDCCTAAIVVNSNSYLFIVILDILNTLVDVDGKTNTGEKIFANMACRGTCISVCYL